MAKAEPSAPAEEISQGTPAESDEDSDAASDLAEKTRAELAGLDDLDI